MANILVVMPVNEAHKELLKSVAGDLSIDYIPAANVTKEDVDAASIIVGNVSPSLIKGSTNLKLMQLNSAGTDGYTAEGVLPEGAVLTNATGAYGLAISEHMIGALLMVMKKFDQYRIDQVNHVWTDHGSVPSIFGSRTLVVGLGDIGKEFAVRMNALGSSVDAIKRIPSDKPDYIDNIYKMDDLYDQLEKADIVATCLPGTPETYKLFNAEAFSHMKDGAFFVNIGRGNAVDSDALCEALNSGKLGGATVDVTDPEPLPADHPLWDAKNLLITPHVSGGYHLQATHDKIIQIAAKNITHYLKGEEFENIVDMKTGYRDNSRI